MNKIDTALKSTNPIYAGFISELAETVGISASDWSWCQGPYPTYQSCPINKYANSQNYKMVVAVHNPSTL